MVKKVKHEIAIARRDYINGHLESQLAKGNSRPLYKYIRSKSSGGSKLTGLEKADGTITQDDQEIANLFQTNFQTTN